MAGLAGCSSSPYWGTLAASVSGRPDANPRISREYTDKLPYASMQTWFEGGVKALLVLGEVLPDGRLVWHSAERQTITTFGAYVVSALGFDRELRSAGLQGEWKPNPLLMPAAREAKRLLDLSVDGDRHQVALASKFTQGSPEDVEILGRSYRLTPVTEQVSHLRRVRFKNQYWVDAATGRCWKSRQTIVPTVPALNIEILKYPSAS